MAAAKSKFRKLAFELMFSLGAEEHEIKRCLRESQKLLIMAKAKAGNLPKTRAQEVAFVAGLGDEAMNVIRAWFAKNARFEGIEPAHAAIARLIALDVPDLSGFALKPQWRSVLAAFSSASCPQEILDFLNGVHVADKDIEAESREEHDVSLESLCISREEVQACSSMLEASVSELQAGGGPLATLLVGTIAAREGNLAVAAEAKKKLSTHGEPSVRSLENLVTAIESHRRAVNPRKDHYRRTLPCDPDAFDPEAVLVLGQVKNHIPNGQFFAKVLGCVKDNELIEFTGEQAKGIYKSSGDVTAWPGTLAGNHHDGEICLWKVAHRAIDKKTQFVITSGAGRAYEVVQVPHSSSDPDGVRMWLQNSYTPRAGVYPLFELTDGLLLRLPGDHGDLSSQRFDKPLDAYSTWNGYIFSNGRRIVLGPLPAAQFKLDCASPITLLKRLLKAGSDSATFPNFSRAQVNSLCQHVASMDSEALGPSLDRAKARLTAVADLRAQLEEVVGDILELPAVQTRVAEEVGKLAKEINAEKSRELEEIARLKEQKGLLVQEIESAKKAARQQAADLSKNVRAAFDKAKADGIATLSQSALYQAILTATCTDHPQPTQERITTQSDAWESAEMGAPLSSAKEISVALRRHGYATGLSAQLLLTVVAAARGCGAVGLVGAKTADVGSVLCGALAGAIGCEVSVSANMFSISDFLNAPALVTLPDRTIALPLGDFLSGQEGRGRLTVIQVHGVNRAPLETFLPELMAAQRLSKRTAGVAWTSTAGTLQCLTFASPAVFVLDFASGASTFPLPDSLSKLLPILATDHGWAEDGTADTSIQARPSHATPPAWADLAVRIDPQPLIVESGGPTGAGHAFALVASRLGLPDAEAIALAHVGLGAGRTASAYAGPFSADVQLLVDSMLPTHQQAVTGLLANQLMGE